MAHFYGELQGSRGQATRLGHKKTGLWAHARGWSIGARVTMCNDELVGDCVIVSLTYGSNGSGCEQNLGVFCRGKEGDIVRVKDRITELRKEGKTDEVKAGIDRLSGLNGFGSALEMLENITKGENNHADS